MGEQEKDEMMLTEYTALDILTGQEYQGFSICNQKFDNMHDKFLPDSDEMLLSISRKAKKRGVPVLEIIITKVKYSNIPNTYNLLRNEN